MREDDAKLDGERELVLYVQRGDDTFGPLQTGSYLVENYLDDLLDKRQRRAASCLERLRRGDVSPVGYYLELLDMTEADLACRAAVGRWRLRRHLTPKGFAKLSLPLLTRYAAVFNVPVAHLFEILVPEGPGVEFRQEATADRHVVVTHVSVKNP